MASVTEELNFVFHLILIDLNLNVCNCTWLVMTTSGSTALRLAVELGSLDQQSLHRLGTY